VGVETLFEEFGTGEARALLVMFGPYASPAGRGSTSTASRGGPVSTLGVDLAVRAAHVATLSDERGEVIWSRRRFTSHPDDLAALSAAVDLRRS